MNYKNLKPLVNLSSELGFRNWWKFWLITSARSLSALIDVFGLVLLGTLVTALSDSRPDPNVKIDIFFLAGGLSLLELSALVALVFLGKTLLGLVSMSWIRNLTASFQLAIGKKLSTLSLSRGGLLAGKYHKPHMSQLLQANDASSIFAKGLVMGTSVAISEAALITILFTSILIISPILTLLLLSVLGLAGLMLQRFVGARISSAALDRRDSDLAIKSDLVGSYLNSDQINFHGKSVLWKKHLTALLSDSAASSAKISFLNFLPRYVIEFAVLAVVFSMLGAYLLLPQDSSSLSNIAIVIFAAFRMSGSLLTMQGGIFSVREATVFIDFFIGLFTKNESGEVLGSENNDIRGKLSQWKKSEIKILAVSGPSGVGKTTSILRSLYSTLDEDGFRGQLGVAPQRVSLIAGGVAKNLTLDPQRRNWVPNKIQKRLIRGLQLAPILHAISTQKDNEVAPLSGGELQRINIMRAHVVEEGFVFLDEPTEGLDMSLKNFLASFISDECNPLRYIVVSHDEQFIEKLGSSVSNLTISSQTFP